MHEDILVRIGRISTPGFFVTADIIKSSDQYPEGIEVFVLQKLSIIQAGATGRKFAFRNNGWHINFTFFPTNQVVDKRYGLMNKMIKEKKISNKVIELKKKALLLHHQYGGLV